MEAAGDTNTSKCPSCNGDNEKGTRFCVGCGNPLPGRKGRFRIRHLLFGGLSLVIIAGVLFLGVGGTESKLAGRVNGEGITREEFSRRVDRAKRFYESRYGQGLFEGQPGKENLNRLKTDTLDEMVQEKILLQEARNAGYTFAPSEEIEKQVDAIKQKYRLSEADLPKMTGGNIEDLKEELRIGWIISQFVEKTVTKGDQKNGELLFGQWLAKTKTKAKIETYEKLEPVVQAKASCCGTGGGCGGGGKAQPLDSKIEQEAKAKGLEYYEKKTLKKGAGAQVTNFGCHIQVDIIQDGKVVASLTYNNGEIQEI
jgi:hypothetical protein